MSAPSSNVPGSCWPDFLSICDNRKKPGVLKQAFRELPVSHEQIFNGLTNLTRQIQQGDERVHSRFYIDGERVNPAQETSFLVKPTDLNLGSYIQRIDSETPGRHGCIISNFQSLDPDIWIQFTGMLVKLYEHSGFPFKKAQTDIFMGNYHRTVFGLHKDNEDVITFVLKGKKRFLVWPFEVFQDTPDLPPNSKEKGMAFPDMDYSDKRDQAIVLEGEPGDVIFWPKEYWHVAETVNDETALTIALGFFCEENPFKGIYTITESLMNDMGLKLPARLPYNGSTTSLLDEVLKVQDASFQHPTIQQNTQAYYLCWLSRFGFDVAPDPDPSQTLSENDKVQICAHAPIVYKQFGSKLFIAINGRSFWMPAHPQIAAMIDKLNVGKEHSVSSLLNTFQGKAQVGEEMVNIDPAQIESLLLRFVREKGLWKS